MIAGRLRECLKILRWEAGDLAAELGRPRGEIAAWLDGRSPAPLAVAAWLEALVKAHRALPAPGRSVPALQPARIEPDAISISYPAAQFTVQRIHSLSPYPRRAALSDARSAPGPAQSRGGKSHESQAV